MYVSEHRKNRAHSYLPHPTLPILNGYKFSRATEWCLLKQRAHKKQLSSIWQNLESKLINGVLFAKMAASVSTLVNTLQTVMGNYISSVFD